MLIIITTIFALASVIYALSIPNQYKVTVLLASAQDQSGGLGGTLDKLGGLAAMAGVTLGGNESTEGLIAQEIMRSWSFVDSFIDDNDLAVEIAAGISMTIGLSYLSSSSRYPDFSANAVIFKIS